MSSSDTIIEVKDGKLSLKQKALRWEDSTTALRELLAFADYLSAASTPNPLTSVPSEHLPLLGKLVIESDKTAPILAKNVKKTIMKKCGAQDDKDALDHPRLPMSTVNNAISEIATRVNYGIQDTPAALAIWRWELKNPDSLLPDSAVDNTCNAGAASERRKEREEAKSQFKIHYDSLDDDQKKALLEKQKKNGTSKDTSSSAAQSSNGKVKKEPTKEVSPVKESKVQVKKANESVDQAPKKSNKQAQMMQSFFKSSNKATAVDKSSKGASISDFERTFKAFLIKKDSHLAPVNFFLARTEISSKGKGKEKADVIILDDDGDIEMSANSPTEASLTSQRPTVTPLLNAGTATGPDLLNNFLSSLPPSNLPPGRRRNESAVQRMAFRPNDPKSKSYSRVNVRTVVTKLTNAEVTDDIKAVRDCEKLLRNRRKVPIKYLQFCDNLRPGYYGTWTKSSTFVGPRTPFTKDPVAFDYSYDSGEEWEEEPEDAEEVLSSAGSEEEDSGSEAEELDDWLVGDDDVEYEPGGVPDQPSRSISPSLPNGGKRKLEVEKEKEKDNKKRRIVKALVPYSTGPHWEDSIGECQDHLRNYRIQLLNDTPYPIDPFTFISEDISVQDGGAQETSARNLAGPGKAAKPVTQDGFVIPALPPHLHPSSQINVPTPVSQTQDGQVAKASGSTKPKPAKKPFPSQHLPQLLNLINGSTLTKLHLVEQLGQEFKAVKEVKKYAIDAALGEVAVKSGGVWTVKEEAWRRCGLTPPAAKL